MTTPIQPLTVNAGNRRPLVAYCRAGCAPGAVINALRQRNLWPEADDSGGVAAHSSDSPVTEHPSPVMHREPPDNPGRLVAVYEYRDAQGMLRGTKGRYEAPNGEKTFRWRWSEAVPKIPIAEMPLWKSEQIGQLPPDYPVVVVEGEKACQACWDAGIAAVTGAWGASQRGFGAAFHVLQGHSVFLWPDNDEAGYDYMRRVATELTGIVDEVRWLDVPNLPVKGDAADYFEARRTVDELEHLMEEALPATEDLTTDGAPQAVVPPFPVAALPPVARRLVEEGAASLACPPDLIAVPLLSIIGGALGNALRLQLKQGWEEYPVLWTAVVAPTGTAKTPAADLARKAVDLLQRDAVQRQRAEQAAYDHLLAGAQKPPRPLLEHFFTTDITIEGLVRALGNDDGCTVGLTVFRDELVAFVKSFDAYRAGRGGDRQVWLSLWSSSDIKSDRAVRDTLYIRKPVVSVTGTVQPERLRDLLDQASESDGFLARFLFTMPPTRALEWTEAVVAESTIVRLAGVLRQVRASSEQRPVHLGDAAQRIFIAWYTDNAQRTNRARGLLRGVLSKLPAQAARLALILHALTYPGNPTAMQVSVETMTAAIELVEYFLSHGQAVLRALGADVSVETPLASRVLRKLVQHGGWVSLTQQRHALGSRVPAENHRSALAELERAGLVEHRTRPADDERGRGRPLEEWRAVNAFNTPNEAHRFDVPSAIPAEDISALSASNAQAAARDADLSLDACGTLPADPSDATDAEAVLIAGSRLGWPRLEYGPDQVVPPGEGIWRALVSAAAPETIEAMISAVLALMDEPRSSTGLPEQESVVLV